MNEIRAAQEELNRTFSEAGQSFYAQNQSPPGGTPGEGPGGAGPTGGEPGAGNTGNTGNTGSKEDVVEADYEIVDESKK
jgi:hypothetical protein